MVIRPIKTQIFNANDKLESFIFKYIKKLKEKSVIVITSKIVALSQGRLVRIEQKEDKEKVIKKESVKYIKTKWCYLTLKNGQWCANAGVDESNVDGGGLILLPTKIYETAHDLRLKLKKHYKVRNLGLLITDSRVLPLRLGVTGVALGYAGFKGLRNYVGKKDLFGRKLKMTQTNIADSLATAAVMEMGEGAESKPVAVIEAVDVQFMERVNKNELNINPLDDLYRPLFQNFKAKYN